MKKNINYFIKKIIVRVAHTTPRSKRKWLFGMDSDFYDNSKYAFLYLNIYHKEIDAIWITKNKVTRDYIRELGYNSYLRWEVLGIWHGLTAGFYFFSHNIYDVNYLLRGKAITINLWHGLPLKRMGFTSKLELKRWKDNGYEVFFLNNYFDYLVSPSKYMHQIFLDTFLINNSNLIECIYPRCEFLNNLDFQNKISITSEMSKLIIEASSFNMSYIYLPTWRDTEVDFFELGGFNLSLLNKYLTYKNEVFFIKLHSLTNPVVANKFYGFSNIRVIDLNITDIYPFLLHSDCLVTDYSSIYFDYLLLEKPIILFPFDIESYKTKSRELAFNYDKMMIGSRVNSFEDLLLIIKNRSYEESLPLVIKHKNEIWCDNNFEAFIDTILQKYPR